MIDDNVSVDIHEVPNDADAVSIESSDVAEEEMVLTEAEIRRNMVFVIMMSVTYWAGWADVSLALAPLMVHLGASNQMIGWVMGAQFMGLPGTFLSPWITRRFRTKKKYMFAVNVPYLSMLAILALVIIYSNQLGLAHSQLITVVFGLVLAHWMFAGFCSLPAQEYLAAAIPMSHRGRYEGYSYTVGGAVAVIVALAAKRILEVVPKPESFGWVILIGYAVMQLGYVSALFAKERPTPVEKSPKPWSKTMVFAALKDAPFIRTVMLFFIYCLLVAPALGFISIYGFKVLKMAAATSAVMQIVMQVARIGTSAPLGHMIDKITPRRALPALLGLTFISFVIPVLLPSPIGIYCSVAVTSILGVGYAAATVALVTGLPTPENRAGHFTVQTLLYYIPASAGPIFMGFMFDTFAYRTVFILMAVVTLGLYPLAARFMKSLPADLKGYH